MTPSTSTSGTAPTINGEAARTKRAKWKTAKPQNTALTTRAHSVRIVIALLQICDDNGEAQLARFQLQQIAVSKVPAMSHHFLAMGHHLPALRQESRCNARVATNALQRLSSCAVQVDSQIENSRTVVRNIDNICLNVLCKPSSCYLSTIAPLLPA